MIEIHNIYPCLCDNSNVVFIAANEYGGSHHIRGQAQSPEQISRQRTGKKNRAVDPDPLDPGIFDLLDPDACFCYVR